jgi:signal transduction histidine kinase
MNLLSNALKFSDAEPVDVHVVAEGDEVRVSVTDRGPGIEPDDQAGLFERFSRLPQSAATSVKGSGLGLYIAKSMTELQGGRIWVESTPGEGSIFSFSFPIATTSS